MTVGTFLNHFPKMVPARNWDCQRPSQPTVSLPCPKDHAAGHERRFVWPGMVLCETLNTANGETEWTIPSVESSIVNKVADVDSTHRVPTLIAIAQDPTYGTQSRNVALADKLVGLPCTGDFRIVTPFFHRDSAYPVGTLLTFATNADVTGADAAAYAAGSILMHGCVRPAQPGELVIGRVVRTYEDKYYVRKWEELEKDSDGKDIPNTWHLVTKGVVNYDDPHYGDAINPPFNEKCEAMALHKSIDEAMDSTALPENSYVIEFDTVTLPFPAPATA